MRPLFVGEDFGNTDPVYHQDKFALSGLSGGRLASFAGLTRAQFIASTDRTNVVEVPEDWDHPVRVEAGAIRVTSMMVGRVVVLLGARVTAALGLDPETPMFEWLDHRGARVARVPHPSGRNRVLNDYATREAFSRFMRGLLR